jgi:putative flippase GtrA
MIDAIPFKQLLRFAVVGGTVMVVFMALNWVLAPHFGAQGGFLAAYPPAVALHFARNKWWTFGSTRRHAGRQVAEYLTMVAVTFVIQWAVFSGMEAVTTLPSWFNAGVANAVQMGVTFAVMRWRVFAKGAAG